MNFWTGFESTEAHPQNLHAGEQTNFKNGQKTQTETSLKKIYRWQIKHMKICSKALITRKLQIKRVVSYYYTHIRMVKIQNTDSIKCS
jgi:hypothetical protein